jgi:AraC-like DNA-binding protein
MSISDNITEINLNLTSKETLTIKKTIKKYKFGFTPTIFVHTEFLPIYTELSNKNGLAGTTISYLVNSLDQYSPFVEIRQNDLATALKASEAHLSKAIKYILSFNHPIIDRVQPGVFVCNPLYVWRMKTELRNCFLDYIDEFGYVEAYNMHKARELARIFEAKYGVV